MIFQLLEESLGFQIEVTTREGLGCSALSARVKSGGRKEGPTLLRNLSGSRIGDPEQGNFSFRDPLLSHVLVFQSDEKSAYQPRFDNGSIRSVCSKTCPCCQSSRGGLYFLVALVDFLVALNGRLVGFASGGSKLHRSGYLTAQLNFVS